MFRECFSLVTVIGPDDKIPLFRLKFLYTAKTKSFIFENFKDFVLTLKQQGRISLNKTIRMILNSMPHILAEYTWHLFII